MFVPACNRPVIRNSSLMGAKGFPPSLPFLHAGLLVTSNIPSTQNQ